MTARTHGWQVFTAAPHRVMMFGGAVQFVATLLFWGTELTGRFTDLWPPLPATVPTTFSHAFLMLYTLFPFFFFGFLMTTYPRWMNGTPVPKSRFVPPFLLLFGGTLLFYVGLFTAKALVIAGTAAILSGYCWGLLTLWGVYRSAPARDKFYETVLNAALFVGAAGMGAFLLWLIQGAWPFYQFARTAGLWWFLIPVILTVGHRMIPFFSSCVLDNYGVFQPKWTLLTLLALSIAHGAGEMAGLERVLWAVDTPFAVLLLYHAWRWGLVRGLSIRLLAVLHIAFVWMGVALGLYALQSLLRALGHGGALERGPLHVLAIGGIASLTIGMATRVTLGHSGRPLVMDASTWAVFWAMGLAAMLRFVASTPMPQAAHYNIGAAIVWLAAAGIWSMRYGSYYLRPRVDGNPG